MRAFLTGTLAFAVLFTTASGCRENARTGDAKSPATKGDLTVAQEAVASGQRLELGREARGTLEESDPRMQDGSHYDLWTYQGRAGEQIAITMRSSRFDSFLFLARQNAAGGLERLASDDDGAGDLDARIEFQLPDDGIYTVMANSYDAGRFGEYSLRVDPASSAARPASSAQPGPASGTEWATRYPGGGDPSERYALLVGIDDYSGIGTTLRGPVADARLIARILVERYQFRQENVVVITDREATRDHIAQAFLRHLGQAGPSGAAVFYYSGHGMQMDDNYALTGDLDPEPDNVDEALYVWGADGRGAPLLDDELGFLADRLTTDRVLFIIDACHSGTGTRGGEGGQAKEVRIRDVRGTMTLPATFLTDGAASARAGGERKGMADLMREPQRHVLLAASADEQVSWTATGWPKYGGTISVFTYYLAEALEEAGPGATFDQIMQRVGERTVAYTNRRYNTPQSPQLEGRRGSAQVREFLARR